MFMVSLRKAYMRIRHNSYRIDSKFTLEEIRELLDLQGNISPSKINQLMKSCMERWPHLIQTHELHGYTCYSFVKHPDWENAQSMDIDSIAIAQPDPVLLETAGFAAAANNNN
jgi:hypothetical protein